ncbi:MAG: DUF2835 domain-containing protein [Thiogranum sp.]|nr:DUF2835 domain-containing protein [Thiogranum sp.]
MADREFVVRLNITASSYERLYRGDARTVITRDAEGRRVSFPADALRRFVTREGISGVFVIRVDADNRLVEIRRSELYQDDQ